jgi:hypothetical protein
VEIIHTRICFKKSGDHHPYGDLAKSGYKPHMKHRILFIFLYLWLPAGVEYSNLAIFPIFFLTFEKLRTLAYKNYFIFSNFQISFCLHFGENSPVEKKQKKSWTVYTHWTDFIHVISVAWKAARCWECTFEDEEEADGAEVVDNEEEDVDADDEDEDV